MYFNKHSYFVIIFKFFLHNNDFITNHLIPIVSFYKKKKITKNQNRKKNSTDIKKNIFKNINYK